MDQLSKLREIVKKPLTIAITSGKGGVGKTNITINLAIELAKKGAKVLVMDADLSLANVNILCGIVSKWTIKDVIFGEKKLEDIIIEGPYNVKIIPGSSGIDALEDMEDGTRRKLIADFKLIENKFDFILIDTAAGVSKNVRSFLLAADEIIIVTTNELTALADAYAMIKIIARKKQVDRVKVLVNMVKNEEEAKEAIARLRLMSAKFLGVEVDDFGFIYEDEAVEAAVEKQIPFVILAPKSRATECIKESVKKILEIKNKKYEKKSLLERIIEVPKAKVVKRVTKKDLIEQIAGIKGISKKKVKKIINAIINSISDGLIRGEKIKIRGFGTFKIVKRKERNYYNILLKRKERVNERYKVKFYPSNALKSKIENARI